MKLLFLLSFLCVNAAAFAAKSSLPQRNIKVTALRSTKSDSTKSGGDATVAATTFNIAKSIVVSIFQILICTLTFFVINYYSSGCWCIIITLWYCFFRRFSCCNCSCIVNVCHYGFSSRL